MSPVTFAARGPIALPATLPPATTFDQSHKTNAALSNGNLTALHSGGGNNDLNAFSVAATTPSQKVYVECNVVQLTFGGFIGFSSNNTSTSRLDSTASTSAGFIFSSGGNFIDADSPDNGVAFCASFVTTNNVDIAFDTQNGRVWTRVNNGPWNSTHAGTQDPGTNQGGAVVVAGAGPFYFFIGADAVDGDGYTATFSSSSWARTVPSGFTQLQ